jgi:DNA-binding winged helix-turn-helix (wHTH) protein
MTIRILADRQPYTSYAARYSEGIDARGPPGPFVVLSGPGSLDGPEADLLTMPIQDFLDLPTAERTGSLVIAYGAASRMSAAFERGCADYLREPWPLQELLARAERILNPRITIDGIRLSLLQDRLYAHGFSSVELTEAERRLTRLLIRNAGLPVTRAAMNYALNDNGASSDRAIDNHISSIRKKIEQVHKGTGKAIVTIRGVGYRLTSSSCG